MLCTSELCVYLHVSNIKCDGSWVISDGSYGSWVNSNDPLPALQSCGRWLYTRPTKSQRYIPNHIVLLLERNMTAEPDSISDIMGDDDVNVAAGAS